jgi:hypothetical protein
VDLELQTNTIIVVAIAAVVCAVIAWFVAKPGT